MLANDTDIDGGPKIAGAVTDPAGGTAFVLITPAGSVIAYTPDANFTGTDTFTYFLNGDSTATVTVTVTAVDDAPTAVDDAATIAETAPRPPSTCWPTTPTSTPAPNR